MKGSVLVLASLCFVAERSVASELCPDEEWEKVGHSCYKFSKDFQSWGDAQTKCKEMGAYLAAVDTREEMDYLEGMMKKIQNNFHRWIGGKFGVRKKIWYWVHSGEVFTFTNWKAGEPSGSGIEVCLLLLYQDQLWGKWKNFPCPFKQLYVCEMRLTCSLGWEKFRTSCYRFSADYEAMLSWNNAQNKCKNLGGYLAEVESRDESEYISKRVKSLSRFSQYWLGGHDAVVEGEWFWTSSGQILRFTNWAKGEPNDLNSSEDCVNIQYDRTEWNDSQCQKTMKYICEISLSSSCQP